MKYLGIDFGLRHVGLALADGPLAEPLGEKKYTSPEELFSYLKRLIDEQEIDKIVVGLPEGKLAETVKKFGEKLAELTGREIIYQDETLSSQEAKSKLLAAGAPQKKRRFDHQAAAALILQEYLDTIK
ncbi:MAG: Holliday junction resolvase RuvX [Candidatus Beckwithbacteria bacterium]|nr:Holliday junction resolvase RuvX [Candidatus Beckwithbacteria bacterium]